MNEYPPSTILAYLGDQQQAMADLLEQLARLESPSLLPETQAPVFALLARFLGQNGYHAEITPGRISGGHMLARPLTLPPAQPKQLLLGHCDTVWPLGTLETMPVERSNGVMRGPGVYDMKAGLVQMLFALQALHDLELTPEVAPHVFINSDEEIGSPESTPIIVRLAQTSDRAFVLEPALGPSGKLRTERKGVGTFSATITGRAAHAGLDPEKGVSAILELSHVIQKLFALNDPQRGISVNVGQIEGGTRSNVVAAESRAQIDVRVLNAEDARQIENAIHNLQPELPGIELEITGAVNRRPLERTPRNQALWALAQDIGRELNISLEEGTAGGASDGNTTSQWTATLDGLGAVGDGAHAAHEFVYLDKMVERAALLAMLLLAPPLNADTGY
jgi:glutamate carboxypeptidase